MANANSLFDTNPLRRENAISVGCHVKEAWLV